MGQRGATCLVPMTYKGSVVSSSSSSSGGVVVEGVSCGVDGLGEGTTLHERRTTRITYRRHNTTPRRHSLQRLGEAVQGNWFA